jgi:hypothetical protein
MRLKIETDFKKAIELLRRCDTKQQQKYMRAGLSAAGSALKRETTKNIRSGLTHSGRSVLSQRYGKLTDRDAVSFKIHDLGTDAPFALVNIMSSRYFRLRFFEAGTKKRFTKKQSSRGSISPKRFFRAAQDALQSRYVDIIAEKSIASMARDFNSGKLK